MVGMKCRAKKKTPSEASELLQRESLRKSSRTTGAVRRRESSLMVEDGAGRWGGHEKT